MNSNELPDVPIVSVPPGVSPVIHLLHERNESARRLLGTAASDYTPFAMRMLDTPSRHWIMRNRSPYRNEMAEAAAMVLPLYGYWTLNTSYEWACTAGIAPSSDGTPVHLRVLDWITHGLGRELCSVVQGPVVMLTWPGYAGCVTGMRRGAFSLALNQPPPGASEGVLGQAYGWAVKRPGRFKSTAMPPGHLLRMVLEKCTTAEDALLMMRDTPVCAGAIFSMAGIMAGESWLVEKDSDRFIVHRDSTVFCANHWPSDKRFVSIRGDSFGRSNRMSEILKNGMPDNAAAQLDGRIILSETRLVCTMHPASGQLTVQGYEKTGPVTRVTAV